MSIAGDGSLFTAKPEQLADLLKGIDSHKVALPDFQRDWVWWPEQVHSLIISVAYRYPAGSLLTMPVSNDSFALRPFKGSGETLRDKPSLMILDGQQRLTSLFQAMYSREGVVRDGKTYHFYLDVPVLLSDDDGAIEVGDPCFDAALFYVKAEKSGKRVRYEGLQPRYELTTPEQEIEAGVLPLWSIFDSDDYVSRWRDRYFLSILGEQAPYAAYMEQNNKWDKLVRPWVDRIKTYPFPVVELKDHVPLGAICHIFEKVNSTGVPLDVFDLCTASLWAQGFRLNREWEKLKKEKLAPRLQMQQLDGTHFLMGLSLLDSLDRKENRSGGLVSVTCRKQDLMMMKRQRVEQLWSVLVDGYCEAAKFMGEQGIISKRILPYSTLIVPLAAIFAYIKWKKGAAYVGGSWDKVGKWYWCSVFSQRYSSQVENVAANDFEQVLAWVNGGAEPSVVRTFLFRSDYLQEISSIRNAIYKGVLCLLARNGAKDFSGGGKLTTELYHGTNHDHHHLFPTHALKDLKIDDPRCESIINKALISYSANRSIGGYKPSVYTKHIVDKWLDGDWSRLDEILLSHAVAPDYLKEDKWEQFLRDRRERLRELIEEACGKMTQPFSDSVDDLEIDAVDEDDESEVALG